MEYHLVLASQSPRRRELLQQAGIPHRAESPQIEEVALPGEAPSTYVRRLAEEKSRAIPLAAGELVLAADTVVVLEEAGVSRILEKPRDANDAREMLRALRGREHLVLTGVCLRSAEESWSVVETTKVIFGAWSDADIEAYIASGEPFDKAGAYAIQGLAAKHVSRIEGCYFNVVGLPLHRVHALLLSALRGGSLSAAS